jgi:hypothetical protein
MTDLDHRRIAEWIGDAFAILCVRVAGFSEAEVKLRLGFEAILRQLGTSPLRAVTKAPPPLYGAPGASTADLRQIIKALDSCLTVFTRYDAVLTTSQRHVAILVRATRRFAGDELAARTARVTALA